MSPAGDLPLLAQGRASSPSSRSKLAGQAVHPAVPSAAVAARRQNQQRRRAAGPPCAEWATRAASRGQPSPPACSIGRGWRAREHRQRRWSLEQAARCPCQEQTLSLHVRRTRQPQRASECLRDKIVVPGSLHGMMHQRSKLGCFKTGSKQGFRRV